MKMSHIIFLHGASSSGKSTIARALQKEISLPFWHISIDHLKDSGALPTARYQNGEFDWTQDRVAFFNGFHASIAAYADAGNNLILEHILDGPGWAKDLKNLLRAHDVLFVSVQCPLPVLREREQIRGDRPTGSAEQDHAFIHTGRQYDLEVDSTEGTESCVKAILAAWRSGTRRSEFN